MSDPVHPATIVDVLRTARLRSSSEAQLQLSIAERLGMFEGVFAYKREVRLSLADRIDFLVDGGIGIEAKLKCAKRTIFRQLERYAASDRISALILIAGTAMGLPPTIGGKPVFYVSLGRTFL